VLCASRFVVRLDAMAPPPTDDAPATALYNLGVMCERGEGVPQDCAEAVRYYRLAAQESALSTEQLALITHACDRIACS
jgi:hypothetical protein